MQDNTKIALINTNQQIEELKSKIDMATNSKEEEIRIQKALQREASMQMVEIQNNLNLHAMLSGAADGLEKRAAELKSKLDLRKNNLDNWSAFQAKRAELLKRIQAKTEYHKQLVTKRTESKANFNKRSTELQAEIDCLSTKLGNAKSEKESWENLKLEKKRKLDEEQTKSKEYRKKIDTIQEEITLAIQKLNQTEAAKKMYVCMIASKLPIKVYSITFSG